MSSSSDPEQPPEGTPEETETMPMVNSAPAPAIPPHTPLPPLSASCPEDEWGPIPEPINMDDKADISASFPVCLFGTIPFILGILSLLLLLVCGFFGYHYFESLQESDKAVKNVNQWLESLSKQDGKLLEIQKSLSENKETLSGLQNQNGYLINSLYELRTQQGDTCGFPLHPSLQYTGRCYFLTMETESWQNCFQVCASVNATFLGTEKGKAMKIMSLLAENNTWIGLSYKEAENKWMWEDGSLPSPGMDSLSTSPGSLGCALVTEEQTTKAADCHEFFPCACVKAGHPKIKGG